MTRTAIAAAVCALLLSLPACRQPADAPAPAAQAPAAPAAPETPAPAVRDAGAVVGTFSGTLPCADCNGIETVLELDAGGAYVQRDLYMGKPAGNTRSTGRWTLEAGGTRLHLVPDDHPDRAVVYGVTTDDRLQMLDRDGNPPKSEFDYGLKRVKVQP